VSRFCVTCGTLLTDEDKFCSMCGTRTRSSLPSHLSGAYESGESPYPVSMADQAEVVQPSPVYYRSRAGSPLARFIVVLAGGFGTLCVLGWLSFRIFGSNAFSLLGHHLSVGSMSAIPLAIPSLGLFLLIFPGVFVVLLFAFAAARSARC